MLPPRTSTRVSKRGRRGAATGARVCRQRAAKEGDTLQEAGGAPFMERVIPAVSAAEAAIRTEAGEEVTAGAMAQVAMAEEVAVAAATAEVGEVGEGGGDR